MTVQTRERNYRKNPHTARFLQTFHSGIGSNGVDYRAELADDAKALELEAGQDDLLDLIPADQVVDHRSSGQITFMTDLITRLTALHPATGEAARAFTELTTSKGGWTPGKDGNASEWISRMLRKEAELKAAAPVAPKLADPEVEIPAGRYAVETDEIRCYTVRYGKPGTRWDGFLFLDRISSDDRFPIRNSVDKARILAAIRADVEASGLLAAMTLRICRGTMTNGQPCGRTLSDTKNPYFSQGYGPECGKKL